VQGNPISIPTDVNTISLISITTNYIAGPTNAIEAIYAAIPGSQALSGRLQGLYGYPCNTEVSITISFGGKAWPISPADMNLGLINTTSALCVGSIAAILNDSSVGSSPSWVVGVTFLV
jgi:cathepsin D